MSFWLFLRIMVGLLAGKTFFKEMLDLDVEYEWEECLVMIVLRVALAFISWWGLTPVLDLL